MSDQIVKEQEKRFAAPPDGRYPSLMWAAILCLTATESTLFFHSVGQPVRFSPSGREGRKIKAMGRHFQTFYNLSRAIVDSLRRPLPPREGVAKESSGTCGSEAWAAKASDSSTVPGSSRPKVRSHKPFCGTVQGPEPPARGAKNRVVAGFRGRGSDAPGAFLQGL